MATPNDFASIVSEIYQGMVANGYTGTEADLAVALSALSDDNGATTKWIDLGASSAYAIAVEHGYTGTEEEWIALLMNITQNAQIAKDSADSAAGSAASAKQSEEAIPAKQEEALQAIASAESDALQSVNTAGTTQTGNVNTAGQAQVQAVNAAGSTQVGLVQEEGSDQRDVIIAEGERQTQRVSNQGILEVQAVTGEGTKQKGEIDAVGQGWVDELEGSGDDLIAEHVADLVLSQDTQPDNQFNKVWLKPSENDLVLAELADVKEVANDVNNLEDAFKEITSTTKNLNITGWGNFMTGPSSKDILEDSTGTRFGMANYVEVEPNTDYAFSLSNSTDRTAISIYWTELDSNQDFIVRNSKTSAFNISNGWGGGTFTTGPNAHYVIVWAYKSGFVFDGSNVQLEKGNIATNYVYPFEAKDDTAREMISPLYEKAGTDWLLPDYWRTYLDERIQEINAYPVPNVGSYDRFIFLSDVHLRYQNRGLKNAGYSNKIAKELMERCNVGAVVFGGDAISSGYESQADVIDALSDFRSYFSNIWDKTYCIDGNHDTGSNNKTGEWDNLNSSTVFALLSLDKIKQYASVYLAGSYYIDNTACKIRYIFLWHNSSNNYTDMSWLATILNSTPSGYTIVVFTHYSLSSDTTIDPKLSNAGRVIDTLNAYTGDAIIACVIGGHIHSVSSAVYTEKGYPVISCYSDLYDVENSGRTKGNTSEQSMQVVQIDTTNKKITLMGIGYADTGTEREYTYWN